LQLLQRRLRQHHLCILPIITSTLLALDALDSATEVEVLGLAIVFGSTKPDTVTFPCSASMLL
jgi:hypothetical protein